MKKKQIVMAIIKTNIIITNITKITNNNQSSNK